MQILSEEFDISLEKEMLMTDEEYFQILFPTEQDWEDCNSGENYLPWEAM